jgi:hypothetical protein
MRGNIIAENDKNITVWKPLSAAEREGKNKKARRISERPLNYYGKEKA